MKGRGNINLKGKKYRVLRCQCCSAWDGRDKVVRGIHASEIKEAKGGFYGNAWRDLSDPAD